MYALYESVARATLVIPNIGTEGAKINLTKGEIDLTVAAPQMTLPSGSEATVTNKNLTITGNQTALLKAGSKLTTTGVLTVTSGSTLVDENAKMYGDGTIVFKAGANGNLGTYPGQKYIGGSDANINLTSVKSTCRQEQRVIREV